MNNPAMYSSALIRNCVQVETDMLVRQVVRTHQAILLQTEDGLQALLVPLDARTALVMEDTYATLMTGDYDADT
jgi:hypothetical protein